MTRRRIVTLAIAAVLTIAAHAAPAAERFITVVSTTSTENSGLFMALLPRFTARTGIEVRVVAVGTGQAIRLARNGDADVLLVHHTASEEQFVADGFGVARFDVMYNDFVIVGPGHDPAEIAATATASAALARLAGRASPFVSRGDDSGTHKRELSLWASAGVNVEAASGTWYRETGSRMGATLNVASAMNAYALTDRATWLKFDNKGGLEILVQGDPRLFNQYGIVLVDAARHPHVKTGDGQAFIDWVLSAEGQAVIGAYRVAGQAAFVPNAKP